MRFKKKNCRHIQDKKGIMSWREERGREGKGDETKFRCIMYMP